MKKISISLMMALCFCAFTNKAMAVSWDIGDKEGWNNYVITAELIDNILTISGDGNMADFSYAGNDNGTPPWYDNEHRSSVRTVIINEGVRNIGNNAFKDCNDLTSVKIASTVTRIGVTSFMNCSSLTSLTIPACVTTIEGGAFYGCSKLTVNCRMTNYPNFEYFPPTKPNFNPINGTIYPFNGISKLRVVPWLINHYSSGTYTKEILYDDELMPTPNFVEQPKNGEARACGNGAVIYKVDLVNGVNYVFSSLTASYQVYNNSETPITNTLPSNYTGVAYVRVYPSWGNNSVIYTLSYRAYLTPPMLNNPTQNGPVINLSWGGVAAATSYTVYRNSTNYVNTATLIKTVSGTSTTDNSPLSGNNYYWIVANNSFTKSDYSNPNPVNFVLPPIVTTYTVTIPTISNGSISPSGNVTIPQGGSQEFIVTPNSGYEVSSISVNGSSVPYTTKTVNGVTEYHFTIENVTANSEISVKFRTRTSDIEEQQAKSIVLYPNPTQDEIFIQSENEIEKIEILDINGRTVGAYGIRPNDIRPNDIRPQNQGECNSTLQNINISALPAGVYFIRMTIDKQLVTKKLVKE
ncbi:MAG: leucine-rich repeat protein [Prevotellaceae bacterium]|jgi:hypothetical protein|nr:leucine-rich repeat protein [Prevotellaceae bacterium]